MQTVLESNKYYQKARSALKEQLNNAMGRIDDLNRLLLRRRTFLRTLSASKQLQTELLQRNPLKIAPVKTKIKREVAVELKIWS